MVGKREVKGRDDFNEMCVPGGFGARCVVKVPADDLFQARESMI